MSPSLRALSISIYIYFILCYVINDQYNSQHSWIIVMIFVNKKLKIVNIHKNKRVEICLLLMQAMKKACVSWL